MSTKEIARLFGVTIRTVRRWKAAGCPTSPGKNGEIVWDVTKVSEWRKEQWSKEE